MLASMFSGRYNIPLEDGVAFIDRDGTVVSCRVLTASAGTHFRHVGLSGLFLSFKPLAYNTRLLQVLNYLRDGAVILPPDSIALRQLLREAEYYQLEGLAGAVAAMLEQLD